MRLYELLVKQDDETIRRLTAEHLEPGETADRVACCHNLDAVLRSPRHVRMTLYNCKPPCFWIVRSALGAGGRLTLTELRERATAETANLAALVNGDQLAGKREGRDLYRRVLVEAWRSDLQLDASEISLLGVLRQELGLSNTDHFLIGHHADFHQFWNTDHAFLDALNALRSSGLFYVVDGYLVLPNDMDGLVRQVLGVEVGNEACLRLFERLGSSELAEALERVHLRTSGSKHERIQRLIDAGVQPSRVLDCVNLAELKEQCSQLRLKATGSKDELVDRLVAHFRIDGDLVPQTQPPPPPEPEARRLDERAFCDLFSMLRGQDLSDLLASIDARRVTGAKEQLIQLLHESPFSEETLLRRLDNRQLEALLKRYELRVAGNKSERIERLLSRDWSQPVAPE